MKSLLVIAILVAGISSTLWIHALATASMPSHSTSPMAYATFFLLYFLPNALLMSSLLFVAKKSLVFRLFGTFLLIPSLFLWLVLGIIYPVCEFDFGGWPADHHSCLTRSQRR